MRRCLRVPLVCFQKGENASRGNVPAGVLCSAAYKSWGSGSDPWAPQTPERYKARPLGHGQERSTDPAAACVRLGDPVPSERSRAQTASWCVTLFTRKSKGGGPTETGNGFLVAQAQGRACSWVRFWGETKILGN